MPLNGEFAKLVGYLTSVIFQLGLYCTLGSNLMTQVNIKLLFLLLMISYTFLCVDILEERLILSSASFYVFIIFFCLRFLFTTYSVCSLQFAKLMARVLTKLIHCVVKVILRLFHDFIK